MSKISDEEYTELTLKVEEVYRTEEIELLEREEK